MPSLSLLWLTWHAWHTDVSTENDIDDHYTQMGHSMDTRTLLIAAKVVLLVLPSSPTLNSYGGITYQPHFHINTNAICGVDRLQSQQLYNKYHHLAPHSYADTCIPVKRPDSFKKTASCDTSKRNFKLLFLDIVRIKKHCIGP